MLSILQGIPDLDPLPEAEQEVIQKALSRYPDQRFPSCVAFLSALQATVEGRAHGIEDSASQSLGDTKVNSAWGRGSTTEENKAVESASLDEPGRPAGGRESRRAAQAWRRPTKRRVLPFLVRLLLVVALLSLLVLGVSLALLDPATLISLFPDRWL
jgi:hypothetical protein